MKAWMGSKRKLIEAKREKKTHNLSSYSKTRAGAVPQSTSPYSSHISTDYFGTNINPLQSKDVFFLADPQDITMIRKRTKGLIPLPDKNAPSGGITDKEKQNLNHHRSQVKDATVIYDIGVDNNHQQDPHLQRDQNQKQVDEEMALLWNDRRFTNRLIDLQAKDKIWDRRLPAADIEQDGRSASQASLALDRGLTSSNGNAPDLGYPEKINPRQEAHGALLTFRQDLQSDEHPNLSISSMERFKFDLQGSRNFFHADLDNHNDSKSKAFQETGEAMPQVDPILLPDNSRFALSGGSLDHQVSSYFERNQDCGVEVNEEDMLNTVLNQDQLQKDKGSTSEIIQLPLIPRRKKSRNEVEGPKCDSAWIKDDTRDYFELFPVHIFDQYQSLLPTSNDDANIPTSVAKKKSRRNEMPMELEVVEKHVLTLLFPLEST